MVLYRERMGFTQQHVAYLLGVRSKTLLSKIEQGHGFPNLKTALKLAVVYRVPVDFLYPDLYSSYREVIRKRELAMFNTEQQQVLPI